jgi:hypothetical protein
LAPADSAACRPFTEPEVDAMAAPSAAKKLMARVESMVVRRSGVELGKDAIAFR